MKYGTYNESERSSIRNDEVRQKRQLSCVYMMRKGERYP